MTLAQQKTRHYEVWNEDARLSALAATGILDTSPEPEFDAITRLAAEYFRANFVWLGFADESRLWMKSCCGLSIGELPRRDSIFETVLAENGPVVGDISLSPEIKHRAIPVRKLQPAFLASVPVRSHDDKILGVLTVFTREPRGITPDELRMLESMANMAAAQLELRRVRHNCYCPTGHGTRSDGQLNHPWLTRQDLLRALEQNQFVLYYQPEIDLRTRRIVGMEALIRWAHPQRGLLQPLDFIPFAEESGLILPIGDWGLAQACNQIRRWCLEDRGRSSLRVCVNLSARQFARPRLTEEIEALLQHDGLSSRQLGLEMTESSLIPDHEIAGEVLQRLHRLGVSLLMDDFGTGYNSLHYLDSFPFDVLKIDRSFVQRMTEGNQPMHIVRNIIELARSLGIDVVAEGIETCEQFSMLRKLGCRYGQGFLFAPPLPADRISDLLQLPGRILPEPTNHASLPN